MHFLHWHEGLSVFFATVNLMHLLTFSELTFGRLVNGLNESSE